MPPSETFKRRTGAALAALISATLPAAGMAAAGRISFAIGPVSAVDKDGQRRDLGRGDAVSAGDTIVTGRGRAQIRFSDGAFVSLQPGSEFRVDEYELEDEDNQRSFFSLLRGGFRTITGLIGKKDRASYKVRTPVATIGIRGTEYLAELGNSLTVTVAGGLLEICNNVGCFLLRPGDTGYLENAEAVIELLRSRGLDIEVLEEEAGTTYTVAEDLDSGGTTTLIDQAVEPRCPDASSCMLAMSWADNDGGTDARGPDGPAPSLVAAQFDSATAMTAYQSAGGNTGTAGTATSAGSTPELAWGRWTGQSSGSAPHPLSLSGAESFDYVVGVPTPTLPSGSARFDLQGFTFPDVAMPNLASTQGQGTVGSTTLVTIGDLASTLGQGTVDSATLNAYFDLGFVDVGMNLSFASGDALSVNASNLNINGAGFSGNDSFTFQTNGSTGLCSSGGCSTKLSGFFAGQNAAQAGLAYSIQSDFPGYISGVAAFTNSGQPALPQEE